MPATTCSWSSQHFSYGQVVQNAYKMENQCLVSSCTYINYLMVWTMLSVHLSPFSPPSYSNSFHPDHPRPNQDPPLISGDATLGNVIGMGNPCRYDTCTWPTPVCGFDRYISLYIWTVYSSASTTNLLFSHSDWVHHHHHHHRHLMMSMVCHWCVRASAGMPTLFLVLWYPPHKDEDMPGHTLSPWQWRNSDDKGQWCSYPHPKVHPHPHPSCDDVTAQQHQCNADNVLSLSLSFALTVAHFAMTWPHIAWQCWCNADNKGRRWPLPLLLLLCPCPHPLCNNTMVWQRQQQRTTMTSPSPSSLTSPSSTSWWHGGMVMSMTKDNDDPTLTHFVTMWRHDGDLTLTLTHFTTMMRSCPHPRTAQWHRRTMMPSSSPHPHTHTHPHHQLHDHDSTVTKTKMVTLSLSLPLPLPTTWEPHQAFRWVCSCSKISQKCYK